MAEEVNIEKALFPEAGIVKKDEDDVVTGIIVDDELDPYECVFGFDEVEINTKDYSHITLSKGKLFELIEMIERAEDMLE